jgi:hypothetical protein
VLTRMVAIRLRTANATSFPKNEITSASAMASVAA